MANAAVGNNNYTAYPSVNLRTTIADITLNDKYNCYLKGTLSGNKFTPCASPFFTTTIPTTDDGYYYVSLGYMYSTYQMILYPEHPIYKFVNGSFKSLEQVAYEAQTDINNLEIGGRNYLTTEKEGKFGAFSYSHRL